MPSPTPHDALFKVFLTAPETARDFLTIHLPDELLQLCNLNTLQLQNTSFIEPDLKYLFSDVLYSMETRQGIGYVYALIEHQSRPDPLMGFRLMRYAISAMQQHIEAGHKTLPLVIPILFYHGQTSPYPYSMDWFDCFEQADIAKGIYNKPFPLVDVTVIPDDEIMHHKRIAVLELIQKHIRQRDLLEITEQLVKLLLSGYTNEKQMKTLLEYIFQVGEAANFTAVLNILVTHIPQQEDTLMTIAEQLRQEGHERGVQLGKQQGIQQGKQAAMIDVAKQMHALKLPLSQIMQVTQLSEKQLKQLLH